MQLPCLQNIFIIKVQGTGKRFEINVNHEKLPKTVQNMLSKIWLDDYWLNTINKSISNKLIVSDVAVL